MTKHLGTREIKTDRLILRRFTIDDAEYMFNNWANDSDVTRFMSWYPHGKIEVTKDLLKSWIANYAKPDSYHWAMELKEIGQVMGSISVIKFECDDRICEVGYCISKEYWNRGITTEALKGVLSFLINDVGVERVGAFHHVDNAASGKVMKKAGMRFEGTLRKHHLGRSGDLEDVDMYSMTDADYIQESTGGI